ITAEIHNDARQHHHAHDRWHRAGPSSHAAHATHATAHTTHTTHPAAHATHATAHATHPTTHTAAHATHTAAHAAHAADLAGGTLSDDAGRQDDAQWASGAIGHGYGHTAVAPALGLDRDLAVAHCLQEIHLRHVLFGVRRRPAG